MVQLSHPYLTIGNTKNLWFFKSLSARWCLCLLICYLGFLPRSKIVLISWLQSPSSVILEPKRKKKKICHSFHFFSFCFQWSAGTRCLHFSFLNVEFQAGFFLSFLTLIKRFFSSSLSAVRVGHVHLRGCRYCSQQNSFQLVIHSDWHFTWCTLHIS